MSILITLHILLAALVIFVIRKYKSLSLESKALLTVLPLGVGAFLLFVSLLAPIRPGNTYYLNDPLTAKIGNTVYWVHGMELREIIPQEKLETFKIKASEELSLYGIVSHTKYEIE